MRAVRSSTVVHYRHADRLSPSNFNWLVRAREWSWQQDITTTKGASLAAVAALLFGGELAVDDAIDTLKRVSLADVVIERDTVWLFIQPAGCSAAYPIALRADTAIWLLHYLLQWVQEQDARPGSRLFGDVSDESIVGLATSLLGVRDLTLADLVSGNRAYLRTIYPADSVAYLAAHWRKLKLACCGPHGAGRRRRYRAGSNPDVAIGRQLRAALRDLTHDQPGARPSTPLVERYLLQRADAWLKDYGQAGCGVARLPLLRAARDVVRADGDESSCNVLLGLLIGAELVRTKSHLSTRSVETYLGRLESWIGQAGDVPLWQTADILDHEHPARRSVILSAANRVFEALDVARLRGSGVRHRIWQGCHVRGLAALLGRRMAGADRPTPRARGHPTKLTVAIHSCLRSPLGGPLQPHVRRGAAKERRGNPSLGEIWTPWCAHAAPRHEPGLGRAAGLAGEPSQASSRRAHHFSHRLTRVPAGAVAP